jgi:branched-subunit amino acid aminotransferase/4-amino-4-deoxychorismate lyase
LLSNYSTCTAYGLVTNLFVVTVDPMDASKPLVLTAPSNQCLPGLARDAVIAACAAEGFAVEVRLQDCRISNLASTKQFCGFKTPTVRLSIPAMLVSQLQGFDSALLFQIIT